MGDAQRELAEAQRAADARAPVGERPAGTRRADGWLSQSSPNPSARPPAPPARYSAFASACTSPKYPLWRKSSSRPPRNPSPAGCCRTSDVPSSCNAKDCPGVSAPCVRARSLDSRLRGAASDAVRPLWNTATAPHHPSSTRAPGWTSLPATRAALRGDQRMLDPKTIRNVAIIAHDGAGKTALTEALLRHDAPARASKDGSTSHLDVDPEETKRNFTVATHITFAEHEGTLLNLLDAPGFSDFLTDADRSMAVCEGGLLLVSAVSGVKHQTEAHWDMAAGTVASAARLREQARQGPRLVPARPRRHREDAEGEAGRAAASDRAGRRVQRRHRPDHHARPCLYAEDRREVRRVHAGGRARAADGGGEAAAHPAGGGGGGDGRFDAGSVPRRQGAWRGRR